MSRIQDRIADILRQEIPNIGIAADAIAGMLIDQLASATLVGALDRVSSLADEWEHSENWMSKIYGKELTQALAQE